MTHRKLRDFAKAPNAELDYGINWGEKWLEGDTLATSEWAILSPNPGGLSITDEAHTATATTVWLAGGVLGQQYLLRNSITTTGGRSDSRVIAVTIRER